MVTCQRSKIKLCHTKPVLIGVLHFIVKHLKMKMNLKTNTLGTFCYDIKMWLVCCYASVVLCLSVLGYVFNPDICYLCTVSTRYYLL